MVTEQFLKTLYQCFAYSVEDQNWGSMALSHSPCDYLNAIIFVGEDQTNLVADDSPLC